jgi:hypothetical protein
MGWAPLWAIFIYKHNLVTLPDSDNEEMLTLEMKVAASSPLLCCQMVYIFFRPNIQNLEGLAIEDVGIFIAILSIFRPNGICILWQFGTCCGYLVHSSPFWYVYGEKSGNPGPLPKKTKLSFFEQSTFIGPTETCDTVKPRGEC